MSSSASSCWCRSSGSGLTRPVPLQWMHGLLALISPRSIAVGTSPTPSHSSQSRLSPARMYSRIFASLSSSGNSFHSRLNAYFIVSSWRRSCMALRFLFLSVHRDPRSPRSFASLCRFSFDPFAYKLSALVVRPLREFSAIVRVEVWQGFLLRYLSRRLPGIGIVLRNVLPDTLHADSQHCRAPPRIQ